MQSDRCKIQSTSIQGWFNSQFGDDLKRHPIWIWSRMHKDPIQIFWVLRHWMWLQFGICLMTCSSFDQYFHSDPVLRLRVRSEPLGHMSNDTSEDLCIIYPKAIARIETRDLLVSSFTISIAQCKSKGQDWSWNPMSLAVV